MAKVRKLTMCLAFVLASGCAFGDAPAAAAAAAVPSVRLTGSIAVGGDREKAVFIEFVGATKATEELRSEMAKRGYKVVRSRARADVVYEVDGAYQALRPGTGRTSEVRAGEFTDNPGSPATKSGRGPSAMFAGSLLGTLIGTAISNLGDSSGARDATNSAATGDPDGKCLAKCESWTYKQRAVLTLTRIEGEAKSMVRAIGTMSGEKLAPGDLFARCSDAIVVATGFPGIAGAVTSEQSRQ